MNIKFFVTGFFVVLFLILATTSEWISKVNVEGDSSVNTSESESAVSSVTPQENDTTSGGIGSSIPSSTTTSNEISGANITA